MTLTVRITDLHWRTQPIAIGVNELLRGAAIALIAAAALAATSVMTPARASDVQRPSEPDVLGLYGQLVGPYAAYKKCVDEATDEAVAAMWEREAPIAAAIYDIGSAYRTCDGFEDFWQTMYFLGFDSPEHWIDFKLRVLRVAAVQRSETDLETMRSGRAWLREAADQVQKAKRMSREEKVLARETLSSMLYVVESLMPQEGDDEKFAQLLELRSDDFVAFLPEDSDERLRAALELAKDQKSKDEQVLRSVKSQMR